MPGDIWHSPKTQRNRVKIEKKKETSSKKSIGNKSQNRTLKRRNVKHCNTSLFTQTNLGEKVGNYPKKCEFGTNMQIHVFIRNALTRGVNYQNKTSATTKKKKQEQQENRGFYVQWQSVCLGHTMGLNRLGTSARCPCNPSDTTLEAW
jgi:hypothetical protein